MLLTALGTAAERASLRLRFERSDDYEILDGEHYQPSELAANFRDIVRVNRYFGGAGTTLRHLEPLVDAIPASQTVTMLDLGTGAADIPLAIVDWARLRGRKVSIVASDVSPAILRLAAARTSGEPAIELECYDARRVPLPDLSVDVSLCSLALHHFSPTDAIQILHEMNRLSRIGFVLNDLRRSRIGYGATWFASRMTTRNRLTRNDAPLSIRRAYTPDELRALLGQAHVDGVRVEKAPWFRMVAVKDARYAGT